MSLGEAMYAAAFFSKIVAQNIADPAAAGEFARFIEAPGADWPGFKSDPATPSAADEDAPETTAPINEQASPEPSGHDQPSRRVPVPPDNDYDAVPGLAHMLRQQQAAMDAALTHFAAHLQPAINAQPSLVGVPEGVKAYRNETAYFRDVLKLSTAQTKKILARVPYVTWTPGMDPTMLAYQPAMPEMAASFAEGNISGENLDRIVGLDQDLTKYVHKTNALPEDKATVMAAFEPALVDAAETATPDELSKE